MHVPAVDALEPRQLFATLTAGVTVATAVSTTRPVKRWTIDLTAGQAIYVTAGTSGDTAFSPQLVLVRPDGKTLTRSAGRRGAMIAGTAPLTGTYTVRVQETAGNTTRSDVSVTAVFTGSTPIVDGDEGTTVVSGDRYFGSIGPGDLDVYRIDATAGAFVLGEIDKAVASSKVGVGVAILNPDGTLLRDYGVGDGDAASGYDSFLINRNPTTQSGDYYAVVYEPGADTSGRYVFGAAIAPGPQSTTDPDTRERLYVHDAGGTRNGTLNPADFDVYRVEIVEGEQLFVKTSRYKGLARIITIVDAAGQDVTIDTRGGGGGELYDTYWDAIAHPDQAGWLYVIVSNAYRHPGDVDTRSGPIDYELNYTLGFT